MYNREMARQKLKIGIDSIMERRCLKGWDVLGSYSYLCVYFVSYLEARCVIATAMSGTMHRMDPEYDTYLMALLWIGMVVGESVVPCT